MKYLFGEHTVIAGERKGVRYNYEIILNNAVINMTKDTDNGVITAEYIIIAFIILTLPSSIMQQYFKVLILNL
jgi:hypothetical protein